MKTENPFVLSGPVPPEKFCDRAKEIELLINSAENSQNTALFSIRRLGKTGLLRQTAAKLSARGMKTVYVDIMMTGSIDEFTYEFAKGLFNQTAGASSKLLKKAGALLRSFTPSLTADPVSGALSLELKLNRAEDFYTDLDNIFDYISSSKDKFFIAIDEFQQVLNYADKNLEAYLRSRVQMIGNASFVFSGSKKHLLLSIFGEYSRPLWQSCSFMELKPIEPDIYADFIIRLFAEAGRKIDREAINVILDISGWITYFVQLICRQLFSRNITNISVAEAKAVAHDVIAERESYFINFTELLTRRQMEFLSALAIEKCEPMPMSFEFLTRHKLGAASTVKSVMDAMITKEIIYKDDMGYRLSDPLFGAWLSGKRGRM